MINLLSFCRKWSLLTLLALIAAAFFYFHLYDYLNLATIQYYQADVKSWTATHHSSALLLYMVSFILMVACGIPCATIFCLIGGFLFGAMAVVYASLATTLGGMLLFFAVRTSLGDYIARFSSGWVKKLERGFQHHAFHYLLVLRLIPIFPCWISNVSAGALNIPLRTFILATVLGIFPATFIYVMAGRGLGEFFAIGKTPTLSLLMTPSILFPLLGLAFLSIFPVFYNRIKRKQNL